VQSYQTVRLNLLSLKKWTAVDFLHDHDLKSVCRRPGRDITTTSVKKIRYMHEKKTVFSDFWHCPHSMRSRIYVTVGCPSGVCLSHHSTAAAACGGFAAESRAGRRYRPTAMAPQNGVGFWSAANADSAVLTAELTRLNTDLLRNNLPIVVGPTANNS